MTISEYFWMQKSVGEVGENLVAAWLMNQGYEVRHSDLREDRDLGIDLFFREKDAAEWKTVQVKYSKSYCDCSDILLETTQNVDAGTDGWWNTCNVDYLVYLGQGVWYGDMINVKDLRALVNEKSDKVRKKTYYNWATDIKTNVILFPKEEMYSHCEVKHIDCRDVK